MSQQTRGDGATTADILSAFAAMRAHGVRFYKTFMSFGELPDTTSVRGAAVPVRHRVLGPRGFMAAGALATLADAALSAVLRRSIGEPTKMATIGLMLQVIREVSARTIVADAETVSLTRRVGVARCKMTNEEGTLVAIATGTFAISNMQMVYPRLFAEQDNATGDSQLPSFPLQELSRHERLILKNVERLLRASSADGPFADFLGIEWQRRGDGEARGRWPLGPHLWNTVGVIHGGAVCGALVAAALACIPGDPPGRILEQHVQFIRPAQGDELVVEAQLSRRGRSVIFVDAAVTNPEHKIVASALITVRGPRAGSDSAIDEPPR